MLLAYELFRLQDMLGQAGCNTAFAYCAGRNDEHFVFHTVPGEWTEQELSMLIRDAYGGIATPMAVASAA